MRMRNFHWLCRKKEFASLVTIIKHDLKIDILSHQQTDEIKDQEFVKSKEGAPIKPANTIIDLTQIAMPLIRSGVSMQSDMRMGWRP
jgi:hypothetical protein